MPKSETTMHKVAKTPRAPSFGVDENQQVRVNIAKRIQFHHRFSGSFGRRINAVIAMEQWPHLRVAESRRRTSTSHGFYSTGAVETVQGLVVVQKKMLKYVFFYKFRLECNTTFVKLLQYMTLIQNLLTRHGYETRKYMRERYALVWLIS